MIDLKNLVSLPTYTTTIPSTGKKVSFRPFVVKEEKVLLIALESKNNEQILNAIKSVIESCFIEKLNVDEMPYFDVEYLFIQLRMKSMGEIVEIIVRDPETKEKFETGMDLEKIKIKNFKNKKEEFNIKLNDNLGVTMTYPNLKNMISIKFNELNSATESVFKLVCSSVETIYTKDQVITTKDRKIEEIESFINNLPKDMFSKLVAFFENMPYVVYEDSYTSPNGKAIPVYVRDFNNFFR
jgi:hypothetical protein